MMSTSQYEAVNLSILRTSCGARYPQRHKKSANGLGVVKIVHSIVNMYPFLKD
jgi:hypothetical protein